MPPVYRRDTAQLGKPEATQAGGLKIPATLARAGVQIYHRADGSEVREWRPSAEVFRADHLAAIAGSPLTLKHPPGGKVNPANFGRVAKGHVGDTVTRVGDAISATVYVQDAEAVRAVQAGVREISQGYWCDTLDEPGVVPAGEPDAGQRYDRVQKNLVPNHTALVPNGRAGTEIGLRLDAADNAIDEEESEPMADKKIEVLDGVEYEVGTAPHAAAKQRCDASAEKLRTDTAAALKAAEELGKKVAALEADAVKLRADAASALLPATIEAAVTERAAIIAKAVEVLGAARSDSKDLALGIAPGTDNATIKAAVIKKLHPDLKLDAAPGFASGVWASILALPAASPAKPRTAPVDKLRQCITPLPVQLRQDGDDKPQGLTLASIRNDAADRDRHRWRKGSR